MAYDKFNKANLSKVRQELNDVLVKYGIDSNIEFSLGSIRFDEDSFRVNLEAKIKGKKSFKEKQSSSDLQAISEIYNLTLEETNGLVLVDYKSRNHKYPFIYQNLSSSKRFKCSIDHAIKMFGTN